MPKFNAGEYLKQAGYTLTGAGDAEGKVRIIDPNGQSGTMDVKGLMKANGLPEDMPVVYNSPDEALDKSPVGLMDRIALGLGNAKGQLTYLKKNYQDAKLGADGDMLVKDKGIWHRVDARGLGDGSGWDMAKELAGDFADIGKDALVGIGSGVGATAGTGVAGPAGALAGAAAGSGVMSGAVAALGRIVGTYEATPEEVAKDIALDSVLGLAGEGVALGAKATIVPTVKAAFAKLGGAAPQLKSAAAGILEAANPGLKQADALRAFDRPSVLARAEAAIAESKIPKAFSTFAPGSDEAVEDVLRRSSVKDAAQIMGGAQQKLSAGWRAKRDAIINAVPAFQNIDANTPIRDALQGMMEVAGDDVIKPVFNSSGEFVSYSLAPPAKIAEKLASAGVDQLSAKSIHKNLGAWMNSATDLMTKPGKYYGKNGMAKVFETMQAFDDFYYNLIDGAPKMEQLFSGVATKLRNDLSLTAGPEVQQSIAEMGAWYAQNKPAVVAAERALKNGVAGIEGAVNGLLSKNTASRDLFERLSALHGNSQAAQYAYDNLLDNMAASSFARALPKTDAPIRKAAMAGAAAVGITPRTVVQGSQRALSAAANTVRRLTPQGKAAFVTDPEAIGALLTTAFGAGDVGGGGDVQR